MSDRERFVALGDNCVDHYRTLGVRAAGGNAVNVAVNWARAGLRSAYMGAVGPDSDGELLRAEIAAQGVDVTHLRTLDGVTAVTLIDLTEDGERILAHEDFGVTADYVPDTGDLDFAAGAAIAHCSTPTGFQADTARALAARGVRVSCDFSTRHVLDGLRDVDVAFYSWESTADDGARALLRRALEAGASTAVVTCGRHGSLAGNAEEVVFVPAREVEVVDTLGAGDSYIAAFLAAWLERRPLIECAARGTAAAAECCQRFGGFPQTATEAVSRAAGGAGVVATKQRRSDDGDQ